MTRTTLTKIIISVLAVELVGSLGALFNVSAIPQWFSQLRRPALAPPSWVFGPVWTMLFLMMGVAVALVWSQGIRLPAVRLALAIFAGQMVLNVLWSALFFGLRNPGAALLEIAVLWLAIGATVISFAAVSRPAAWLLVPYWAWVSFATYLNYGFWRLN